MNVVMDYNRKCLFPFVIDQLLQFGKVEQTIRYLFYVVIAFCLLANCFLNGFYLPSFCSLI
jgi:hypothetical protein